MCLQALTAFEPFFWSPESGVISVSSAASAISEDEFTAGRDGSDSLLKNPKIRQK
jgi:hypothetical protein